jgi:hypothetical protein
VTALRILLARLRGLFGGDVRRDRELRAEIDAHIAEATEEFERQGVPADKARRLAFARFGGVTQTMEAHRDRRRFRPFGSFGQDLAYGARMLVRSPGFTLVAVLTLTIGILANTTTISAVNAVLFWPLAIEQPAEVLQIFNGSSETFSPIPAAPDVVRCGEDRSGDLRSGGRDAGHRGIPGELSSSAPCHSRRSACCAENGLSHRRRKLVGAANSERKES